MAVAFQTPHPLLRAADAPFLQQGRSSYSFSVSVSCPQRCLSRPSPSPAHSRSLPAMSSARDVDVDLNLNANDRHPSPFNDQSRRNFVQSLCTVTGTAFLALTLSPTSSQAYSSPYRPGEDSNPLPDRLYERPANQVVTTDTGLQYFDLSTGPSGPPAEKGDTVIVNYTSRLRGLNGIKIDSSFETDRPFIFRVGADDVVPGVSEAVQGMKVGGKRRAVLPPPIAYASPDMKPPVTEFFARRRLLSVLETNRDATIVFDLELLKIKS